jgi:hypothetical protein
MSTRTNGPGSSGGRDERISADDLQRKIQSLQDTIQGSVEDQKSRLVAVGGVALVAALLLLFLLGRRSGRKRSTFVEIRRF